MRPIAKAAKPSAVPLGALHIQIVEIVLLFSAASLLAALLLNLAIV
jgi:hypothetical protein